MDYKQMADQIVDLVGGVENISSLTHCMTRLRFNLKNESIAKTSEIENIDGVIAVIKQSGVYMVVVGQKVSSVYEQIVKNYNIKEEAAINENLDVEKSDSKIKNIFNGIISYISNSITPSLLALIAAGLLKVVMTIGTTYFGMETTSFEYQLFNSGAQAVFHFLPIFIAYGAARYLKCNVGIAMLIMGAFVYPDFINIVSAGETVSFFGIPVTLMSYTSSVIPALLSVYVLSKFEKGLSKIIPEMFRSVLVPLLSVLIMLPLTAIILGPWGLIVGKYVIEFLLFVQETAGWLGLGVIAALLPFLVMAGMHTLLVPTMIESIATIGYDAFVRAALILHNISEGGATFGVLLKTKNKEKRVELTSIVVSAVVAGVTEPAIYGVNMRYKKPMIGVMAGGLVGGIYAGIMGVKAFEMGLSSVIGVVVFGETMMYMLIAVIIAFVVSTAVTFVLLKSEEVNK